MAGLILPHLSLIKNKCRFSFDTLTYNSGATQTMNGIYF